MELIAWVLLAVVLLVSCLLLTKRGSSGYRLPPGPKGLPILGCPWALLSEFHVLFTHMADTWGEIFTLNVFGENHVVLNSAEVVREAYASPDTANQFSGRPPAPNFATESLINSITFMCPSPVLTKRRKLVHKILLHYGDGLRETERTIQEELSRVIDWLENAGHSVNMDEVIYPSLINILTILLKGNRFEYGSAALENVRLLDESAARGATATSGLLLSVLPILKHLPVGPGRHARDNVRSTHQFEQDYFYQSKATYNPDVTRGMIDFLLRHQEELRVETGSSWLDDDSIKAIIQEMVGAGSITTRGALYSFFLIIVHKPEVARRIQDEIEAVVGSCRFPCLEDRPNMPYTVAAIFELLRYISHVPIGVPRVTTTDVTFRGYIIPAKTKVMANIWLIHHDDKIWDDPWEFKPQRFLNEEGNLLSADHPNRKNLLPFGIGRRSCVGEAFAKSRMFLFITTLLQRFHFTRDPTKPLPSCDPRTYTGGLVFSPYPYYVTVTKRE